MKLAMAQINPTIGDFDGNLSKIRGAINKARSLEADLVALPEMTTTGYPPKDFLEHQDFIQKNLDLISSLIETTEGIAVVCGHIERNVKETGKPLVNAGIFFADGRVLARFSKMLLPTYDVFDETRYFEPADQPTMIDFRDKRIGLTICEDIWNDRDFFPRQIYHCDPIDELVNRGANLIINISASPYYHGKGQFKLQMLRNVAKKYRVFVVYVNQVGGNDDLLFDGCSLVLGPDGDVCAQAAEFEEDLVVFDTDRLEGNKRQLPVDEQASILKGLIIGTRDYMKKSGFHRAIVGLSGGIDSSLVLYIAVRAIGSENVMGVAMPSPYSSKESVEDARDLSKRLGVAFRVIPITGIFESYLQDLRSNFQGTEQDVTEENIQARIRGNLLMALSNKFGAIVLSTGNKSEMAVGYCTLYGDMSGGLAVISDVPKTMVYDLARYINSTEKAIPERVLTKPPSAELRPNQLDQDSLPPYELLDPILDHYIENKKSPDRIAQLGYDPSVVKQVIGMVNRNEYKRKQAPIGLKITSKAFGYGRRYPIVHGYR